MVFKFMKKKKATKRKPAKKKVKKKTTKRKTGKKPAFGGYQIKPDENLAKIIGNKPVTPAEMTKKIWQYIKKKKLSNR